MDQLRRWTWPGSNEALPWSAGSRPWLKQQRRVLQEHQARDFGHRDRPEILAFEATGSSVREDRHGSLEISITRPSTTSEGIGLPNWSRMSIANPPAAGSLPMCVEWPATPAEFPVAMLSSQTWKSLKCPDHTAADRSPHD